MKKQSTWGVWERFPGKFYIRYTDATHRPRCERVTWKKIAEAKIQFDAKSKLQEPGRDLAAKLWTFRKAAISRGEVMAQLHSRCVAFSELCEDALVYVKLHNRGWKHDANRIATLKAKFGPVAADAFPIAELRKWIADHEWSSATQNRYKAVLSLTYRLAIENGKAKTNPAKLLKRRTETNHRLRWLLPDEEVKLRVTMESNYRWHLPEFDVAVNTGLRPSEQFSLRWSDVDLDRRQITLLQTKTGKPRHIPLNAACLLAFQELKKRPIQGEYVFTGRDGQRLVGYRWFEDAAKDAGITINWYESTRHTFASRLTMAGVDLRTVANLMGHSTIQMTMRYAHLAPEHLMAAVECLNAKNVKSLTSTLTSAKKEAEQEVDTVQ